jgi:hypothetical protein
MPHRLFFIYILAGYYHKSEIEPSFSLVHMNFVFSQTVDETHTTRIVSARDEKTITFSYASPDTKAPCENKGMKGHLIILIIRSFPFPILNASF